MIKIEDVVQENWRDVYNLKLKENQKDFVTAPGYYLCLCSFGDLWHPLAIRLNNKVIGFMMWAIDRDNNSCWLGGILIDKDYQGKGYGKRAIRAAIDILMEQEKPSSFALSYSPENPARHLYHTLGFQESGEMEDDEVVARL